MHKTLTNKGSQIEKIEKSTFNMKEDNAITFEREDKGTKRGQININFYILRLGL